jgi:hypothetical protein
VPLFWFFLLFSVFSSLTAILILIFCSFESNFRRVATCSKFPISVVLRVKKWLTLTLMDPLVWRGRTLLNLARQRVYCIHWALITRKSKYGLTVSHCLILASGCSVFELLSLLSMLIGFMGCEEVLTMISLRRRKKAGRLRDSKTCRSYCQTSA